MGWIPLYKFTIFYQYSNIHWTIEGFFVQLKILFYTIYFNHVSNFSQILMTSLQTQLYILLSHSLLKKQNRLKKKTRTINTHNYSIKPQKWRQKYVNKKLIRQKKCPNKTKWDESSQKYHWVYFVLALKYDWYIQWASIGENWLGGGVSGYQLQTASCLGLGACIHFLHFPILPLVIALHLS